MVLIMLSSCSRSYTNIIPNAKSDPAKKSELNANFSANTYTFTASPLPSEKIMLSKAVAEEICNFLTAQDNDYPYSDMYELEEVKKRLDFDAKVENHRLSALDTSGRLTGSHLADIAKKNNDEYLATKPFGFEAVEDDYITEICDFIVLVTEQMLNKYPDIERDRVYCNLGALKILYDTGMLSYAEVSQDMILSISKNNTEILLNMKGEDGFTRVMVHEIMHIIQLGCACENIENCGRRAGISVYWDDFTLNTADWTWMVEGSAERNMCSLTGGDAVTYQYKMDYLCSMTMSVLLRDSVKADTMETLCFYSDPEKLFETFDCKTQEQRDELLNYMITLQVLQMQPKSFHIAYKEKTGIDLLADEEAMNRFSYSLKPAACLTLTKEFYENLARFIRDHQPTCNDVFFLINLFEGQLDQHLNYTVDSKKEVNEPFIEGYTAIREKVFASLEAENPTLDLNSLYEQYDITAAGTDLYNAELSMLSKEKLSFLAERALWLKEFSTLGRKVPLN